MTPIYYAENTFTFYLGYRSKPDANIPTEFAKAIGPVKVSSIVSLKLDRPVHIPILEPLAAFPGLERLHIKGPALKCRRGWDRIWSSQTELTQEFLAFCQSRPDVLVTKGAYDNDEPTKFT